MSKVTARDVLVHEFGLVYATAAMNLEGMTQADSLAQPAGNANCANWILGHLVSVQNAVMEVAGLEPVWRSAELERAGFDPIRAPEQAIDWDTLVARFLSSRDRCLAGIAALSDEVLAARVTDPFGNDVSRAELLSTLAYHQAYHIGQLGIVRRAAGLPGAIRGPGQPAVTA